MAKTLDARGLACPTPVLLTKEAVEKNNLNVVEVIVDNEAAKENVSRFLGSQSFSVTATQEGEDYKIHAQRLGDVRDHSAEPEEFRPSKTSDQIQKIMVLMATDRLGFGDERDNSHRLAASRTRDSPVSR